MEIAMSSDNNYADIMATSIYSILKNNINEEVINFHIIDDGISKNKKNKIIKIIENYNNANINFIDFNIFEKKIDNLIKGTNPPLPIITFARLFLADIIEANRIIYIDCDTICNDSLHELWNIDLNENILAGVLDTVNDEIKIKIGLDKNSSYINAGVLVIDLEKWRTLSCTRLAIDFIKENEGNVLHNDQGVINAIFSNKIKILDLKYNVTTPIFMISRKKILNYFKIDNYYTLDELSHAKKNPVIIHFVRFTTTRPWEEKCIHPLKNKFMELYEKANEESLKLRKYEINRVEKIDFFILNYFPYIFHKVYKIIILFLIQVKKYIRR